MIYVLFIYDTFWGEFSKPKYSYI